MGMKWWDQADINLTGARETATVESKAEEDEVEVDLSGDGKDRGRVPDDGGVHSAKSGHGRVVHCYGIASGPV